MASTKLQINSNDQNSNRSLLTNELAKLLGLAQRARKLSLGMGATLRAIHKSKAHLVILASDVSDNTKIKIENAAKTKEVPVIRYSSKKDLGLRFGREELGVIGILDSSFARAITELLE